MPKQTFLIIFLIILFPFAYFFGFKLGKNYGISQTQKEYQAKLQKLYPQPEEIKNIFGEIISIDNNKIKIKGTLPISNPFVEAKTLEYEFAITDQTKIIKRTVKTEGEIKTEMAKGLGAVYTPFNEKIIKIEDLNIGIMVQIEAKDNLKTTVKSTAERVIFETTMNLSV